MLRTGQRDTRSAGVGMRCNGAAREVSVEVVPLIRHGGKERYFVVLFDESPPAILEHFGLVAALRSYCSRGAGEMHRSLRDIFQLPRASLRSKKRHAGRLRVNHYHAGIGNEVTCIFVGYWIKSKDGVFRQQ
jgi:hypothetical protein